MRGALLAVLLATAGLPAAVATGEAAAKYDHPGGPDALGKLTDSGAS